MSLPEVPQSKWGAYDHVSVAGLTKYIVTVVKCRNEMTDEWGWYLELGALWG